MIFIYDLDHYAVSIFALFITEDLHQMNITKRCLSNCRSPEIHTIFLLACSRVEFLAIFQSIRSSSVFTIDWKPSQSVLSSLLPLS